MPARASCSAAPSWRMPSWNQTTRRAPRQRQDLGGVAGQELGPPEDVDDVDRLRRSASVATTRTAEHLGAGQRRIDAAAAVAAPWQIGRHVEGRLAAAPPSHPARRPCAPRAGYASSPASSSIRLARQSLSAVRIHARDSVSARAASAASSPGLAAQRLDAPAPDALDPARALRGPRRRLGDRARSAGWAAARPGPGRSAVAAGPPPAERLDAAARGARACVGRGGAAARAARPRAA